MTRLPDHPIGLQAAALTLHTLALVFLIALAGFSEFKEMRDYGLLWYTAASFTLSMVCCCYKWVISSDILAQAMLMGAFYGALGGDAEQGVLLSFSVLAPWIGTNLVLNLYDNTPRVKSVGYKVIMVYLFLLITVAYSPMLHTAFAESVTDPRVVQLAIACSVGCAYLAMAIWLELVGFTNG